MDRTQAFIEYGRILDDSLDWLESGYRRNHDVPDVRPPVSPSRVFTAPSGDAESLPGADPRPRGGMPSGDRAEPFAAPDHPAADPGALPPAGRSPENASESSALAEITGEIASCRQCNLYLLREDTVPGIGRTGATVMVVTPPPADLARSGMSPLPASEDEYLGRWLAALGLDPVNDTFITPAVKCRTPGGRPPQPEEAAACTGYLRRQYKAVRPKAVLALGGAACGALTGNPGDFPSLVGRDWTWGAVPALVLWTPAEVLANPGRLRKPVWDALQRLKAAWNAVPGN